MPFGFFTLTRPDNRELLSIMYRFLCGFNGTARTFSHNSTGMRRIWLKHCRNVRLRASMNPGKFRLCSSSYKRAFYRFFEYRFSRPNGGGSTWNRKFAYTITFEKEKCRITLRNSSSKWSIFIRAEVRCAEGIKSGGRTESATRA